jgi:hypothetical protein
MVRKATRLRKGTRIGDRVSLGTLTATGPAALLAASGFRAAFSHEGHTHGDERA